jgi:hypothetical protein
MVRIVRQIPAEIRVEMESILVRSGRYRGEAGGHFGPDARAALRAWVLAEGWLDAREIAAPAAGAPAAAATGPASPASQERTVSEAASRKVYDRSVKLSHAAKNSAENQAAIRLVNELARYGDPAARWFIVDRYDENSDIPKVVSPAEVIRYNLDLLLARPSNMPKLDFKLIFNVTAVTMKRREPRAFAAAFMDALRDDPRLQHAGGLGAVLGHLSFAPMACDAIAAFATRELRIQGMGKEGCDPASRDALIAYAKARGAAGVDSKARLAAREAIEDLARRMN